MQETFKSAPARAQPPANYDSDPAVEDMLRRLIAYLDARVGPDAREPNGHDGQDILLDACIDGHYYTLARVSLERDGITLSPRETEIVRLVARGLPTKTIADVLDVSLWTVSTHLRRVFAKLQVNTRAEMVARALHEGLI